MALDPILEELFGNHDAPVPPDGDAVQHGPPDGDVAQEQQAIVDGVNQAIVAGLNQQAQQQARVTFEEQDAVGRVMAHAHTEERERARRAAQGLPPGPGQKDIKFTTRPRLQVEDGRLIRAPKDKVVVDIELPARRLGGIQHWILEDDGKTPKLLDANDPNITITWGRWFERANRQMKITRLPPDVKVSTVFLGIDHNFMGEGPPLLFETMCFSALFDDEYMSRAATYDEAIAQHVATVAMMRRVIQRHKIKKFFGKFLFWRRWTRG